MKSLILINAIITIEMIVLLLLVCRITRLWLRAINSLLDEIIEGFKWKVS